MTSSRLSRRQLLRLSLTTPLWAGLALPGASRALASALPPIRVIVPFPAGGPLDVAVRLVTQVMAQSLGQGFVIDNKPGAGTVIGTEMAARAAADGLTLLAVSNSFTINPKLQPSLPYDTARDFRPLGLLAGTPVVLCARPGLSVTGLADLVALLKSGGQKLSFASTGNGTLTHLLGEMLSQQLGVAMTHVPYKGTPPAMNDLAANHVDLSFGLFTDVMPLVRAGRIKALGVASAARVAQAPELPTLAEQVPALDLMGSGWFALVVPTGVPADTMRRLETALNQALVQPEVQSVMATRGFVAASGGSAALQALLSSESARYAAIIDHARIRID